MKKVLTIFIILAFLIIAGIYLIPEKSKEGQAIPEQKQTPLGKVKKAIESVKPSSKIGESTGKNSITVKNQAPDDSIVIDTVTLEKPGFVVIYEDFEGSPRAILVISPLLKAGTTHNIEIGMETKAGESYFAILHTDNGDSSFGSIDDDPHIRDEKGDVVMTRFEIQ